MSSNNESKIFYRFPVSCKNNNVVRPAAGAAI